MTVRFIKLNVRTFVFKEEQGGGDNVYEEVRVIHKGRGGVSQGYRSLAKKSAVAARN